MRARFVIAQIAREPHHQARQLHIYNVYAPAKRHRIAADLSHAPPRTHTRRPSLTYYNRHNIHPRTLEHTHTSYGARARCFSSKPSHIAAESAAAAAEAASSSYIVRVVAAQTNFGYTGIVCVLCGIRRTRLRPLRGGPAD